jgi:amino acid transporter
LATALQLAVIAAILTALSTLLGYMPTAMIGGLVVLGGYATFSLPYYIMLLPHSPASWLLWLFYWLLPNWQHFSNAVERTTHWGFWVWLGAYALGQCVAYLALGIAIFHSRDIA